MNLVGNAIKFTEHGSVHIQVGVARTAQNAPVPPTHKDAPHDARSMDLIGCAITDTGIGIAPDRLARVFDEFTQAESDHSRRFGGSGLGLTICKRLVEMQGGTIGAESKLGQGSTFTFTVPYGEDQDAVREVVITHKHTSTPTWGTLSDLRILLVEDNKMNVAVARVELEYAVRNLTLDVAVNGQLALEKLRTNDYDLVLMDVQMPVMDGYEATRTIRSWNDAKARIPIIAMTANVMEAEVQQCRDAGMDGFIPKPFKQAQLVEAIRAALGH
jgi:CheY-like chemotaxis protein